MWVLMSAPDQGRYHGHVPNDRSGVREKELVVTVQYAQAPGREHQQGSTGKESLNQFDGEQTLIPVESGREEIDQPGRGKDPRDHYDRRDEEEKCEDRLGELYGFFFVALRVEPRINRDEGR